MNNNLALENILSKFNIVSNVKEYGNGHINDTYIVNPNNYILQRINTKIFSNPEKLMENIERVTSFLRTKIIENGGNPDRETLTVIPTDSGEPFYKADENNVFRVYKFIEDSITIEDGSNLNNLYNAGKGFGRFQNMLSDFPAKELHETIKDFHNTPKRIETFKNTVKEDPVNRVASCKEEIDFVINNCDFTNVVVNGLASGEIPLRVTHNDTKINNILFDKKTKEAICVIDLDTVMPGSALYDFGDALRIGGSTAAEDETNLDKVEFNIEAFRSFAKGYCEEMKSSLTKREIELLPLSVKLLTFECGVRFLTDYLNGDTYFKIHRKNHNLERARNQFKLVKDISEKEQQLKEIVNEIIKL